VTHADQTAIVVLSEVTNIVAQVDGPISARVASGVLLAIAGVIRERRAAISVSVLEAIMGLVVALREDIAA
jgi:hypothetical protein